jgi:molecular chaperone DnaJ
METCPNCHGSGVEVRVQRTLLGNMQTQTTCQRCGGSGKIIKERCTHCGGQGLVRKEDIVTVNIPAGVAEGMTLRMGGKGNEAPGGGIPGDLLVVIEEERHPQLMRDGNDLVYNLMLDFPTAVFGGKVEVPTVDGHARVTIPAGIQPGKVLRLRGKGLPSPDSYGTGDLLINVMVYVPEQLNSQEKAAIESLKGSENLMPNEQTKNRIFSRLKRIFDND